MSKMKHLLDILSNPNKRTQIETLNKCEVVLEKLDFARVSSTHVQYLQYFNVFPAHLVFFFLFSLYSILNTRQHILLATYLLPPQWVP